MKTFLSHAVKRLTKTFNSELGVSTLEYIGLAAVVVALIGATVTFVGVNGQPIASAVSDSMNSMIISLESGSGGGSVGQVGQPTVGQPGVGQPGVSQPDFGQSSEQDSTDDGADSEPPQDQNPPDGWLAITCPDCGPDWIDIGAEFTWDFINPVSGGAVREALEASRIVPYGKYVKVFKGAPDGLKPGRYLANNVRITPYTTAGGVLKHGLTSGSAWASNGIFAVGWNLIDFGFDPDKSLWSSDFFASATVDTIVGVGAGALAGAAVTGLLAAAGVATAPAWLVALGTAAAGTALVAGVDWLTCKIFGTGAIDWTKEKVAQAYDGAANLVKNGWNKVAGFFT